MIREKIKDIKDTTPWPPQLQNLDEAEIKMTDYLHLLLKKNCYLDVLTKEVVG